MKNEEILNQAIGVNWFRQQNLFVIGRIEGNCIVWRPYMPIGGLNVNR